jgi:hypothetical protein
MSDLVVDNGVVAVDDDGDEDDDDDEDDEDVISLLFRSKCNGSVGGMF